ncbi:(Fe-S)-binding protein [Acetonema longum]|uniref:Glycolate oxidase iron-sulfur subunit n=1 Tax=Acetonema longum DSM 6540 TaxID=1009370 RepID=F7NMX1_9FIRM|nr:(Fe-S)-binding protein [Acetonema longum]EGO62615.1 hypothetical protein ALO_17271 [Acetonema longum DSM 6540]
MSEKLIAELSEIIKGCSRCGYCMAECPAYKATKIEWDVARGRNWLASELANGAIQFDSDLDDPIDTCLRCGRCKENCPSKVDTPKAVQLTRTIRYKKGKMKLPYRLLFERIMPYPKRMAMGSKVMGRIQAIGPDGWLTKGIIARCCPPVWAMPTLPKRNARDILPAHNAAIGPRRGSVLYFVGCATGLVYPEAAEATVRLLTSQGVDVTIPDVSCCGTPPYSYGHIDGALLLVRRNLEVLNVKEVDAVISDCATCVSFLREYEDLPLADALKDKAKALRGKVKNLSDYLLSLGLLAPKHTVDKIVTYHQPCHYAHSLDGADAVEQILKNLPGIEFRKAANQNTCCGGAGSYCFSQVKRSRSILDTKLDGIVATEADAVVTNCPACMMQLQAGLRQLEGSKPIKVINTANLLADIYSDKH